MTFFQRGALLTTGMAIDSYCVHYLWLYSLLQNSPLITISVPQRLPENLKQTWGKAFWQCISFDITHIVHGIRAQSAF